MILDLRSHGIKTQTELLEMTASLTCFSSPSILLSSPSFSIFFLLSPAVIKLKALNGIAGCFRWVDKHFTPSKASILLFSTLVALKKKSKPAWRDGRTEGQGALWCDQFQPRENKEAAREKYTRPQVEPGLHPGEATQRKSPALGLSAARRGQRCLCYSNMVSTWAKLPSHLFNTQTPHGAPRCHKAKGSYKHLMWGRLYRAACCFCFFFTCVFLSSYFQ